jgi:hypothetical protein
MIQLKIDIDAAAAFKALSQLDDKASRKALRPAVQAVAKLNLDELKRLSPRSTGAFKRSLMVVTRKPRPNGKSITCLVGQRKQRKVGKTSRKAIGVGSQITRAGKAVPIHFLDRSTKAHQIKPSSNRVIRFPGLTRASSGGIRVTRAGKITATKGKNKAGFIFAKIVNHPGTQPQYLIAKTSKNTRLKSGGVFNQVVIQHLK